MLPRDPASPFCLLCTCDQTVNIGNMQRSSLFFTVFAIVFTICKGNTVTRCECPAGHEPWDIYDKAEAGGKFTTKCIKKQLCYATCSATPCVTPEIKCFDEATKTEKPGTRPKYDIPAMMGAYASVVECTDDSKCPGQQVCELQVPSNKKKCVDPVPDGDKCGGCPPLFFGICSVQSAFYEHECTSDKECSADNKCCACGSTKKCMGPATAPFFIPAPAPAPAPPPAPTTP